MSIPFLSDGARIFLCERRVSHHCPFFFFSSLPAVPFAEASDAKGGPP